jgi:hypothetical protein
MSQHDRNDIEASSSDLDSYRHLTARVQGGRTTNKQPLDIELNGFHGIADLIDLSGCYGEGSRNLYYPFPIDTEYNPLTDGGSLAS